MSLKIFLPRECFYAKKNLDIYGELQINPDSAVSYFIIATFFEQSQNSEKDKIERNAAEKCMRLLGHISEAGPGSDLQQRDVSISFCYDNKTPNIYLRQLNIKPEDAKHVSIFLYDISKVMEMHNPLPDINFPYMSKGSGDQIYYEVDDLEEIQMLYYLQKECRKQILSPRRGDIENDDDLFTKAVNFPNNNLCDIFNLVSKFQLTVKILQKTVFFEHFHKWVKVVETKRRNINLAMDRVLGIFLMLILFFIPDAGDYLILGSQYIIQYVRMFLDALRGNPVGLKLNEHLNNFFLDCFNYHIDIWAIFIEIIEPAIRYIFIPIALCGLLGISFQLALLADLITVLGLHAYCFYVYTAVLYKFTTHNLGVLWRVMRGKRYNMLKSDYKPIIITLRERVESYDFVNRQLYISTLFFATFLFLFPTILVYYIIFTLVRLCVYMIKLVLQLFRHYILLFPISIFCKWLRRSFYEKDSIQLQHISHAPSPLQSQSTQMETYVFSIRVMSSSLGRVFSCENGILKELTTSQSSLKDIINRILDGKF